MAAFMKALQGNLESEQDLLLSHTKRRLSFGLQRKLAKAAMHCNLEPG